MTQLDSALVLFSGGQDSTVCLAWALERFARVETIGFAYGQRHAVELEVRPRIRASLGAHSPQWRARLGDDHMVRIDALAEVSETALTREVAIEITESGLPTTFVPGRTIVSVELIATQFASVMCNPGLVAPDSASPPIAIVSKHRARAQSHHQ